MYKVLLAEDEVLVRLGLMNSVPWAKYDMEVVASVSNGTEAYEKYLELKPHLIITDIRMPGMDGTELIGQIRKEDTGCIIIVVSCLDDFFILRDMIKYSILGYVLKASMTISEIEDFLNQAKIELDGRFGDSVVKVLPRPSLGSLLKQYISATNPDFSLLAKLAVEATISDFSDNMFNSFTLCRITQHSGKPLNELAQSFIHSMFMEHMAESTTISLSENCILALHPKSAVEQVGTRLLRIQKLVQSFFNVDMHSVSHTLRGGLSTLPKEIAAVQEICDSKKTGGCEQLVQRAMDYMLSNYEQNLTLSEISEYVGLSPNYFSMLFKKESGISFVSYLMNVRIEEAKYLLENSEDYLYKISEDVGFNNFEYFSKVFKQYVGTSPAEWRRQWKNRLAEGCSGSKTNSVET